MEDSTGGNESDYGSSRKAGRKRGSKHSSVSTPTTPSEESSKMPSVEDVCNSFGLTDVQIKYTEQDYQNLSSYKLFQQHIRPLLAKDNPKVCVSIIQF